MNRIYRVIWNCTLQVFQACSELTRRVGKTSTVNLHKSSGLTTKFSRLTLGVLLALSGSASGASLEVDNDQIINIDTDVAYDAYLVGWYGTGVLNILAGGNASLTTITTSVIGGNENSKGTVNVLGGTWRLYDSGNNARPLNVGQSGTGTLNIKQKGHVDGGYLRIGSSTGGVGTVNVEGEDSVLTTELFEIGSYGTGSLNITDKGYVTSSIVAIVGYQANSNGKVVVEKGGEWLIKNNDSSIEFQIGNQGTGEAIIREGGVITAENTIIGGNATGIGTLNVQDQDSVITVRRLYNGYFGNGTVNISNNGLINNKEYSLVGVQDGSHGVVNVTDKGHWNFLGTGEAFRYIYIGDAGDGELNVSSEGKVDSGIITTGMKETGTGNITVKDKNSVITNLGTNLGYDGHGEMNISNEGLVVSNGGSSLGYGETGVGKVSITTGGIWEVNKNVYTTIGVAGVGNLNISDGGKFVSQNITFLGDKASGIGTLNLMDATSSFDTVGINVGNFGSGIVNVSNGATLNSTGYGFIGGNASGKGIVNISTDSLWNLKTSSTNAQLLQVGVLGTGELNITTGGIVKARDTQIALNDKSKGDVRVDGQNSLLETFNMNVGTTGTGTLTLTNNGTLNVEGGEVYLGVFDPAVGTLNIGAAHGEAAADAGYITNATKVEFGSGEGVFVFNHTNNSDAGYQVDMLITGDDKDGKVIHDAGHTVFNAGNTYSGKTLVNDGLLTIASHTADGVTGMGSSEVTIANPGTLDILASTNSAGDYTLTNALKGDGLMRVQLSSSDKMFGFTHATGTEFAGVAQFKDSTFTLERDNTAALTHAMLQSDSENTTSVKVGEQSIGGLAMNGGTLIFDTDIPAATLAEGYISVDTLVVGAGDYTWKGRNYQVNGTGDVLFDLLSEIGRDSVGAVTLIPEDETVTHPIMAWEKLTEARLEEVLTAYKADIPLGMIREENDFRISVAGAQEKTALLRIGNDWCIPKGITPTTHIIKLPIGEIRQPNATLDLSQSVDNEYYCLLLAKELGLNVPDAEIIKAGNVRALAVERFDRRWNAERTVLLRLPQEDMCQTFGLTSSVKYESDGGPGIARIMAFLMGSSEALKDRYDFMKFQVFQWLIGATDGHAKNFSVFIQAGGSYRLTPFYDIISAFPVLGGAGIHISDLKLAMGLNASKGKKTAIDKIYPRHFLATAKLLKFPEVQMHEILSDFARMIPAALDNVKTSLPTDFPENVVTAVETNVLRLHGRLSREYGIK
ncbi:TPA: hypothetical protein HI015_000644 [Escherichia coli]|nr:lipoprotein/autotransporter domain-containing protein [Escherichia coli]HAI2000156.1 hypothetical protein [Escherichia coli]